MSPTNLRPVSLSGLPPVILLTALLYMLLPAILYMLFPAIISLRASSPLDAADAGPEASDAGYADAGAPDADGGDWPEEGRAVLCDFLCITDTKDTRCSWLCEDPLFEVACGECGYVVRDGKAMFNCLDCDVGSY